MSVNAIGAGTGSWKLSPASGQNSSSQGVEGAGRHRHGGKSPIDVAAKALGMTADDLVSELQQNKSLDDVATEKGVSHEDLVAALKAGKPADGPVAADGVKADLFVDAMTSQKGGPKPPPGGGGRKPFGMQGVGQATGVFGSSMTTQQTDMLDSLSSLLGTSSDDLLGQLTSGTTSLASMVSQKGISSSSLAQVLQNGLLLDTKA